MELYVSEICEPVYDLKEFSDIVIGDVNGAHAVIPYARNIAATVCGSSKNRNPANGPARILINFMKQRLVVAGQFVRLFPRTPSKGISNEPNQIDNHLFIFGKINDPVKFRVWIPLGSQLVGVVNRRNNWLRVIISSGGKYSMHYAVLKVTA